VEFNKDTVQDGGKIRTLIAGQREGFCIRSINIYIYIISSCKTSVLNPFFGISFYFYSCNFCATVYCTRRSENKVRSALNSELTKNHFLKVCFGTLVDLLMKQLKQHCFVLLNFWLGQVVHHFRLLNILRN
jgi:hypothetical protein